VLKDFSHIEDVLMIGIAGGVPSPNDPDDDVRLGDVVVSTRRGLIQYDMIKLEDNAEPIIRSEMPLPSAHLLSYVNRLASEVFDERYPWEDHIGRAIIANAKWSRPNKDTDPNHQIWSAAPPDDPRREGQPVIHLGIIGSANALLKSPTVRDNLKRKLQIVAVEMEGSGIADATWVFRCGYLVIRGISDYCDKDKSQLKRWRPYASIAAASYARALLERIPAPQ
jgi:nucleoside phosphorylase